MGEAFMPALIVAIITAVIGVIAYFAYAQFLQRTVGGDSSK
jgi:Tfp pilus assembly protein PilE